MTDPKEPVDGAADSGSEEESEYEIEQVLDAKRGHFPDGRMGYFVKWKGYGESENSWVDERDAANAEDLVKEYWNKHPQKKKPAPRKSTDKKSPRKPRKSAAPDDSSEVESVSVKKRGRKSSVKKAEDAMDVEEASATRPPKKSRKNSASRTRAESSEAEGMKIGTMKEYMHMPDWEGLVKTVDTVEREGEILIVYFTLTSNEAVREVSEVCKKRFPHKLLDFYESNLRWKAAVDEND